VLSGRIDDTAYDRPRMTGRVRRSGAAFGLPAPSANTALENKKNSIACVSDA
jgi:hypothetical protein